MDKKKDKNGMKISKSIEKHQKSQIKKGFRKIALYGSAIIIIGTVLITILARLSNYNRYDYLMTVGRMYLTITMFLLGFVTGVFFMYKYLTRSSPRNMIPKDIREKIDNLPDGVSIDGD